jgi:NAD(P)-dependent dehydrogenase (short-subunit alcohol dehydrogenase family)
MGGHLTQAFPPKPTFTDANVPSQKGKVILVTGGYSGVGYELAAILYRTGAKVYVAGRSEEKAKEAISKIKEASASASNLGSLEFLSVDLTDLDTVKAAAQRFQAQESKLDLLFNNAGIAAQGPLKLSVQGYEQHLAVNCLAPYLLTTLLLPQLRAAAESPSAPAGSVRVVWASSQVVDLLAPKGGIAWSDLSKPPTNQDRNYATSKTGNYFLAFEFARRLGAETKILSVTLNPGTLKTNLFRDRGSLFKFAVSPLMFPPVYGAYTNLYAGFSPDLTLDKSGGAYIVPWGRLHPSMRTDILAAVKDKEHGGTGVARDFWDFCDEKTKEFQ